MKKLREITEAFGMGRGGAGQAFMKCRLCGKKMKHYNLKTHMKVAHRDYDKKTDDKKTETEKKSKDITESKNRRQTEFDPGKAVWIRQQTHMSTPEFQKLHNHVVNAATEAYKKGTEHLKSVGGITNVINNAAKEHDHTYDAGHGIKARASTLLNHNDIRFKAQQAALKKE